MNSEISLHEQIILLSIFRLGDNAYGVTLKENITKITKREIHYGTLYNTLNKMVRKEYVATQKGEPTNERGGRSKIYYSLTELGGRRLQEAKELQAAMWFDIPDNIEVT